MEEYIFSADLLNKFSQLTPWVQVTTSFICAGVILGVSYFLKEAIAAIMKPFCQNKDSV